jgi:CheY-like chemotaxis protein
MARVTVNINVMTKGPIIIIDDDADDRQLYADILKTFGIPNQIHFFADGQSGLDYLVTTKEQPFIILSDINMPQMTGLELKEIIQGNDYLKQKGIPFVFISTSANADYVRKAQVLSVQGYFEKPSSIEGIRNMLKRIFEYWELCKHINNT